MDSGLGFVQPMFFIGVVEDRNDPRVEGRVRVRAFGVHGSNRDIPTEELPWATLIIGSHDVNFTPPPLNAWVFGFFIDGRDAQQPMILGLIPSQSVEVIDPSVVGWGAQPAENYDRHMQGSRARDVGTSPMSNLATCEFLNETYNASLEVNRAREIPIACGGARSYAPGGNGNAWSDDRGEGQDGSAVVGPPRPGLTPDRQRAILDFASRNGINPNALVGVLDIESGLDPNSRGGASNNFYGIFQLQGEQIPGLTQSALNRSLTPLQYRGLSFDDQLLVYQQYIDQWIPNPRSFFTGDPNQDASRLWALQLAPGNARRIDYNNPNATISATNQASSISASAGLVTVGSVQSGTLERGGLLSVDAPGPDLAGSIDDSVNSTLPTAAQSRAQEIRDRISAIDEELQRYQGSDTLDPPDRARIEELQAERERLQRELAQTAPSASTESQAGEPYSGYADGPTPGAVATWDEPASAYAAQYPFNRVIETASGHSIELDDTPGGERIMIWHQSGSYIQISTTATTHKNMGDSYNIHERNHHVYIKGTNIVTIDGDCYTLIKGNKVEEIQGDYRQIVHGSSQMGAARNIEINGAARTDIRSASLALDSNVENLNIRTGKNIVFESGDSISLSSRNVRIGASENMSVFGANGLFLQSDNGIHMKAAGNMFINPEQSLFMRASGGTIALQAGQSIRANAGSSVSLKAMSTMDIQAESNMVIQSGATINMNADGILSLKADGDVFVDGSGDAHIRAGSTLFMGGDNSTQIKSEDVIIQGASSLSLKGENTVIEGESELHARGATVYIDDVVQLSSGAADSAVDATAPEVKEPIQTAAYSSEDEGFDISPEANAAPSAEAATPAASGASGPAEPPAPSVPAGELTGDDPEAGANAPAAGTSDTNIDDLDLPLVDQVALRDERRIVDGPLKTITRQTVPNRTNMYHPTIENDTGGRAHTGGTTVHDAYYAGYSSGLRAVWEDSLPEGVQLGRNVIGDNQFYVTELTDANGRRFYTTTDFVRSASTGEYVRINGRGEIVDLATGRAGPPLSSTIPGAQLPTPGQAVAITTAARDRSQGEVLRFEYAGDPIRGEISLTDPAGRAQVELHNRLLREQTSRITTPPGDLAPTRSPMPPRRSDGASPVSSAPIPSSAEVAGASGDEASGIGRATQTDAINLGATSLVGVFGTTGAPRALVRQPTGIMVRAGVGEVIPGVGTVTAIGQETLTYTPIGGGTSQTLTIAGQ